MTFSTVTRLDGGSLFPRITLAVAGGVYLTLPGDWTGHAGAVLFYRGHW